MGADEARPQILLRGIRRRGNVRGALLVLEGSTRRELSRAAAWSGLLADSCVLVAVDGGLATCRAAKRTPDLFVGDGDSVRKLPADIPSVLFPREKDFSDLSGALVEVRNRRAEVVVMCGLAGGRIDHEWANLLEVGCGAKHFAAILAPTPRGLVLVTSRGCRALTVPGRTVSMLAPCGQATVSLRGTRFTLSRRRIGPGSLGLSNVTGKGLHLVVHAGAVALVFPSR